MNILLLRSWKVNIGNAIIDKGARAIVKRAFPEASITEVSGYPGLVENRRSMSILHSMNALINDYINLEYWKILKMGVRNQISSKSQSSSFADLPSKMNFDLAVLPGYVLTQHVLSPYNSILEKISNRDIPIILLGAGGSYDRPSKEYVEKKINTHSIAGIITRDEVAYEYYNSCIDQCYNGIDCGFFINNWYSPPDSTEKFVAFTFDKSSEPSIETEYNVIRPDHEPFDNAHFGILYSLKNRYKNIQKENILISDLVEDYLFVYANSETTYSDRIHACVPTLAYGNPVSFRFDTSRAALFERVFEDDIKNKIVEPDINRLENEKRKQVAKFKEIVESLI